MSDVDAPTATLSGVVVVLLVDFLRQHRAWGWMRMVQGPSALKSTPGLLFAKVMGSGHDGGFGLRPSASHQGWVCLFDTHAHARAFLAGPPLLKAATGEVATEEELVLLRRSWLQNGCHFQTEDGYY
jgi:hypothetical protein